ncbi:MAG: S-layer homology domain-containing protein [Butyricicoccus sp.]|nr:S-layer homology domain-containing protein [Butyricicoccus sp.]
MNWKDEKDETGVTYKHAQVVVTAVGEDVPDVNARNNDYTLDFYTNRVKSLEITTPPQKVSYSMAEKFDPAEMVVKAVYSDETEAVVPAGAYTVSPTGGLLISDKAVTVSYKGQTVTQPITVAKDLTGEGTAESPFQLSTAEDLKLVSAYVAAGYPFEGEYLQLTDNIDLPADWIPIGALTTGTTDINDAKQGVNIRPFSGTLDGNDKTITFAKNSKPLFNYVREAAVHDLTIYAPYMDGYALVDKYTVDYGPDGEYGTGTGGSYEPGCPDTIDITNVTIKSGSIIKNGGFLGGYASGGNTVNMTDCAVEKGVKIGCTASGASAGNIQVGSLAGAFSGKMLNCVSYADVYGTDTVGGLVGCKGQSMGYFEIINCAFYGSVHATGDTVGGIVGSGYINSSAGNTMCVKINNCIFDGTVEGRNNVGGILGAEGHLQAWDNGVGNISNNLSMGKISASGAKGGIVGDISSLNRYNTLDNNYYLKTQADKGIGAAAYVDTSAATTTAVSGVTYINTADELPGIKYISKTGHNRDDDPLGRDAEKLSKAFETAEIADGSVIQALNEGTHSTKNWILDEDGKPAFSGEAIAYKLEVTGYKDSYYIGESLDWSGATFTVTMSDDTTKTLTLSELEISGFDNKKQNVSHVVVRYQTARAELEIRVLKPSSGDVSKDNITVSFTLMGDSAHGEPTAATGTHTLKGGGLTTWISKTDYTLGLNATVWDLMQEAAKGNDKLTIGNPSGNYVDEITYDGVTIGEFTNGSLSGWMYTLNGKHPNLGVSEQFLDDGDAIVFHYTDDYTKEEGSEQWSGGTTGTQNPPADTNDEGEAKATITEDDLNDAIANAKTDGADTIVISPEVKGDAGKVSVELPKSGVDNISKQTNADLKVETGIVDITIPQESLGDLVSQPGEKVTASAETVKDESGKPTGEVKIEIAVDGKSIDKLSGGIMAEIPVEDGNVLVIVNADGSESVVKKSIVDNKTVKAILDGSCTVKVVDNSKHFDDTATHWSRDAVAFASSHELFNGTGENTFSPDAPMNRAMLATVLYRLEDAAATGSSPFDDVASGTWYSDAVTWASNAGIVNGTGSGFDPDGSITREQLAAMLYRYAGTLGMSTSASGDLSKFSDGGTTSDWARDAMSWAIGSGLISGKGNGVLDPIGSTTRAEVAVIMQRLVGLMVK